MTYFMAINASVIFVFSHCRVWEAAADGSCHGVLVVVQQSELPPGKLGAGSNAGVLLPV